MRSAPTQNPVAIIAAGEELAGCLCPLLLALSFVPSPLLGPTVAIVCLWLGLGHSLLYYCNRMPLTRARPFVRGIVALFSGLLWPLLIAPLVRARAR